MKIVIVDDDQLVALSLKTILEANEKITVVGTGNDGTVSGELGDSVKDLGDGVGNAVDDIGNAVGNAVEGR